MMKTIKLIRLITGEEILAEVVVDSGYKLTIKNPLRVVVVPSKSSPNNPTVGLAPWAEFSDDESFTIDLDKILVIMNPVKEFVSQYNSVFSGIITPTSGLVLPQGT